jgi:hypothetical protein
MAIFGMGIVDRQKETFVTLNKFVNKKISFLILFEKNPPRNK